MLPDSAKSVPVSQPSTMETATAEVPPPSTSLRPGAVESQDDSHPMILPQSGPQNASEIPKTQASPQTASDGAGVPPGGAINRTSEPPKQEENPRFLGIPAYQGHSYGDRSYDYMRKYPPDAEGKELDPEARLWKVYLDECESYDNDMVKGFRDTIDSLLVFAALFSSVVTGFVVQTSQALEPDYALIGASLLFEQIEVLRAAGNVTRIQEIPRSPLTPDSVTHSSLDVAINWMFFTSLAFSLATALVAVLIKQWLQEFTALVPGDAKVRSLTRQFRFSGLQKWKLSQIINILPLFLHLALAFFLIGLCLFVSRFHPSIIVMVAVATCSAIAFFVITAALPAIHLDCPYRLPILYIPACLALYFTRMIHFKVLRQPSPSLPLSLLRSQEQRRVSEDSEKLQALSLTWLFNQTTNISVQRIALHGVSNFLQFPRFWSLRSSTCTSEEKQSDIALRDLLPLKSMSMAAIRLLTPNAQPEDGPLLRDVVTQSRELYDGPVLPDGAWVHALDSPYGPELVEAEVLPMNSTFKYQSSTSRSPLDNALERGKWETAISLLKCYPNSLVLRRDEHERTPLGHASLFPSAWDKDTISHENWVTIFSMTKDQGVDFNTYHCARDGQTVLHLVCAYGTVAALQHLISHVPGFDLNVASSKGHTPLHRAFHGHHQLLGPRRSPQDEHTVVSIVQLLLANGGDVRRKDAFGFTPLHVACGIWINPYSRWLNGPSAERNLFLDSIHFEIDHPIPLAVRELLAAGADPNALDSSGHLPLHRACIAFVQMGCSEADLIVFQDLLPVTANVNVISQEGFTPLDVLELGNKKDSGQGDKREWQAAYSLMRQHGARLAKEVIQIVDQESPQSATLGLTGVDS